MPTSTSTQRSAQRVDGRDARWTQHRTRRRRELVESTLRAIRAHGAAVGMDDIAAAAGTSKTVIYRHFEGRTGLYLAVVDAVDQRILSDLDKATDGTDPDDIVTLIAEMVDGFLGLVEKDREIYRFVITRPILDGHLAGHLEADPVAGLAGRIGSELTAALTSYLARRGQDTAPAATWGHGLVGFIRGATDHWLSTDHPRTRAQVVADVRTLMLRALPPEQPPSSTREPELTRDQEQR